MQEKFAYLPPVHFLISLGDCSIYGSIFINLAFTPKRTRAMLICIFDAASFFGTFLIKKTSPSPQRGHGNIVHTTNHDSKFLAPNILPADLQTWRLRKPKIKQETDLKIHI